MTAPVLPPDYSVWDVMRCLYQSEINCGLSSFWDGGFTAWLGDHLNGRDWQCEYLKEQFGLIAEDMHRAALEAYPDSAFAALNPITPHLQRTTRQSVWEVFLRFAGKER